MAYYLIDFENVKNVQGVNALSKDDKVVFFYSKNANSLNFSLHVEISKSQASFEYFEIVNCGKNALDFQLSTYLGNLIAKYPQEKIYIVSKDTGFDNVIAFCSKYLSYSKVARIENFVNVKPNQKAIKEATSDTDSLSMVEILTLKSADLDINHDEIIKISEIFDQYKTRQAINGNMVKFFKNSEKVGKINRVIKPFLKTKS